MRKSTVENVIVRAESKLDRPPKDVQAPCRIRGKHKHNDLEVRMASRRKLISIVKDHDRSVEARLLIPRTLASATEIKNQLFILKGFKRDLQRVGQYGHTHLLGSHAYLTQDEIRDLLIQLTFAV